MIPSIMAMTSKPYETPNAPGPGRKRRRRRRLITAGCTCIAIAFVCVGATVVGMMRSFSVLAQSETPSPRDLADGIAIALVPSYLGAPLMIAGIVLVIAGPLSRRDQYGEVVAETRRNTYDKD